MPATVGPSAGPKPFRSLGLVRRVTPFIGAGLIALVVLADPSFSLSPWTDALAVMVASGTTMAALIAPVNWNRLPRPTMAVSLVVGFLLALGATFSQGSLRPLAAAVAGSLVILAIYVVPWDGFPRWAHNLPLIGGIATVFVIQATVQTPGHAGSGVLMVFPLYLTTVLFGALYHTRKEVWSASALASIGILFLAISDRGPAAQPALAILVIAVLWVVVLTVQAVVQQRHSAEERLRLLIGSVKDYAILTLDPGGNVTSWNSGAELIEGYTPDEVLGRNFSCFYPDDDVKAGKPQIQLAQAAQVGRFEDEGWRVRKDGTRFWAEVVIASLRDSDGRLRGYGTFARDISGRKQTEDAIKALNEQLVALVAERTSTNATLAEQKRFVDSLMDNLDELGVGLVVITGQTMEYVNDAFRRMTGFRDEEVRSIPPVTALIAPEYLDEYRRQFAARISGAGDVFIHEFEIIARDGHRIPVESIARSELVDGKPHGVAMILDITDRKQAELALAQSEARLQAIVDGSLTAIVTMDSRGAVTGWNPRAEATFGWPKEDILGELLADTIIPPQHRQGHRDGLARYLATGDGPVLGKVLELSALHRDGREFPVELAINPASAPGGQPLFVGFVRDITARRQSEDAIKKLNAELLIANRHKSEFLAHMSHELRTPLNAILGFSELIIDDVTNKFEPAQRRKFVEQINTSGRHLLGLINDILDISKVEAGQMVLQLASVSAAEIVSTVVETIEPMAAKKEITVETDVAGAGTLRADALKLKQMLLNLASNAVKFTHDKGRVKISARRIGTAVEFSVADNGIGIAEADLGRLFKDFTQLDSGPGRLEEGTGLGLALTKRLAELHGGEIGVASKLGSGSVFTIKLPLAAPAATAARPVDTEDTRPLVLVVEDDHQASDLLVRHLEDGGFRAEIAVNGHEAVAKARKLQPVAVTLDILLPGIDGWDVLTQLKHDDSTRDIPVVVISVVDKRELGRALGAIDYFVKPVDAKALLARLAKFRSTSRVAGEDFQVLVVDDEQANLDWSANVLSSAGISVLSASGGREGIDMAKIHLPQLILLDLMMPEVSGFDVVEALDADPSTRSIPIIILTAKDLTAEDKQKLNGHAKAILARG